MLILSILPRHHYKHDCSVNSRKIIIIPCRCACRVSCRKTKKRKEDRGRTPSHHLLSAASAPWRSPSLPFLPALEALAVLAAKHAHVFSHSIFSMTSAICSFAFSTGNLIAQSSHITSHRITSCRMVSYGSNRTHTSLMYVRPLYTAEEVQLKRL